MQLITPYFIDPVAAPVLLVTRDGELVEQPLDLRLADAIADVVDEQIDIGVRLGFMRHNRFVARAVAKMSFVVAAAPRLVARTGVPASPEALAALPTTG